MNYNDYKKGMEAEQDKKNETKKLTHDGCCALIGILLFLILMVILYLYTTR